MTIGQSVGVTLLRVTVGAIYVMHGYLAAAVLGPSGIAGYTARMGFPPSLGPLLAGYHIAAHLGGGVLLVLGLWSRWAALAQLPIMLSALVLLHWPQGFFLTGIILDAPSGRAIAGGYEYVLLLVVATAALVFAGGGGFGLDRRRR